MSDAQQPFGFSPFLPGMDFLQQLAKAGQGPAASQLSHWTSPSLSVEEIDKRIEDLKAVQFWLEQNSSALTAAVQALQVQKMTLSTLQSMNVNLGEMAKAFPWTAAMAGGSATAQDAASAAPSALADWPMSAPSSKVGKSTTSATRGKDAAAATAPKATSHAPDATDNKPKDTPAPAAQAPHAGTAGLEALGSATALQWWGALTQQFQHIAAQAMQDPVQQEALQKAGSMAAQWTQAATKTASDLLQQASSAASAAVARNAAADAAPAATPKAAPAVVGTAAANGAAVGKPKAASAGKAAGKTAPKAAAKAGAAAPSKATTTASLKSTTGAPVFADKSTARAVPKKTAGTRSD